MAGNLTDAAELLMLDWVHHVGSPTQPTSPLKVRLMTTNGSDSAAGTEVVDAGGSAYVRQSVTLSAASGGATSNSADVVFTNMPACTVTGIEIWDSAGTSVRIWYMPLTASKVVNLGDTFTLPATTIALSLD